MQSDAYYGYNRTMVVPALYSRYAEIPLAEALADSPAVLIHGPRQCGKTTLARLVGGTKGYQYISFDDDVARSAADADPMGFVGGLPERVILDEVQRVPSLFTAMKQEIDTRRVSGRFLLTGSSQVPVGSSPFGFLGWPDGDTATQSAIPERNIRRHTQFP